MAVAIPSDRSRAYKISLRLYIVKVTHIICNHGAFDIIFGYTINFTTIRKETTKICTEIMFDTVSRIGLVAAFPAFEACSHCRSSSNIRAILNPQHRSCYKP